MLGYTVKLHRRGRSENAMFRVFIDSGRANGVSTGLTDGRGSQSAVRSGGGEGGSKGRQQGEMEEVRTGKNGVRQIFDCLHVASVSDSLRNPSE